MKLNRKKEALDCYFKAVAIERDQFRLSNLANAIEELGNKEEAL